MKKSILKITGVCKSFEVGNQKVPVLKDVSFEIEEGDFVVIFGPSGCGKSTLLHVMLGLEEPNRGSVEFMGKNIWLNSSEDDRSDWRKKYVGMVYQQPNWVRSLTVVENVAFPLLLLGIEPVKRLEMANKMLMTVGMEAWSEYVTTELSSGQQQRVALARAMVTSPKLVITDEPTGNLDYKSGQTLMQLLFSVNKIDGKTVLMVTHDLEYLDFAKTALKMFDGKIIGRYGAKDKKKLLLEMRGKRGNGND